MKKFFVHCKTKQEAKQLFRQLAKQYHPDTNRDIDTTEIMKAIIAEYEICMKKLPTEKPNINNTEETEEQHNSRISAEMQEIIDNITHLPLDIEIIGNWVWVSGNNTYAYKSYLTAYNFTWCANKKMYAWHGGERHKKYGKTKEINEIRETYGTQKVYNKFRAALA